MDATLDRLTGLLEDHPQNEVVQEVLTRLTELSRSDAPPSADSVKMLESDLSRLREQGLFGQTPEDMKLIEELQKTMPPRSGLDGAGEQERFSIVAPPPSSPLLPLALTATTLLPAELLDTLHHTYFLHLLATDPAQVLPPGKSLLSVLSRPSTSAPPPGTPPGLQERVSHIVHKAFWDEAYAALASPLPATEIPRLKVLYADLHTTLAPLLPAGHPALVALAAPLPPTSAPLRSALALLREVLEALRARCAPARDGQADQILRSLDVEARAGAPELARAVVDAVRDTLKLAEAMREDLSQFVLGTMGEAQLKAVVSSEARTRERTLVLELWKPDRVRELWGLWAAHELPLDLLPLEAEHPRARWVLRLVHALGSTVPVACPLPTVTLHSDSPARPDSPSPSPTPPEHPNALPPPLFFLTYALLRLQNHLQALVIVASLRSLVRLPAAPPPSSAGAHPSPAADFTARVWALLLAAVDEDPGAGATRLAHLADEVVRVRRLVSPADAEEEARLRTAVDRTLQPRDSVFLLLQKRLLHALAARLCEPAPVDTAAERAQVPERLQTGRRSAPRVPMRVVEDERPGGERRERPLVVKGFEDEVLVGAVGDTLRGLRGAVEWAQGVWPDLAERGELDDTDSD